jgi:hypothetical protein
VPILSFITRPRPACRPRPQPSEELTVDTSKLDSKTINALSQFWYDYRAFGALGCDRANAFSTLSMIWRAKFGEELTLSKAVNICQQISAESA